MAKNPVIQKLGGAIDDARRRRRPSGYDFSICDSIRFVRPDDWDAAAVDGSIFLRREVLRAIESHGPKGIRHRYVVLYDGGLPVAIVACQLLTIAGSQLTAEQLDEASDEDLNRLKLSARKLRRQTLERISRRVIVCGNLLAWGSHGFHISAKANRETIWEGIAEALYRVRRNDRLHGQTHYTLVKDFEDTEAAGASDLQHYRYRTHQTEPDMVLDLADDWHSLDDYLAALNKKYRKAARTVIKAIDESDLTIERHRSVPTEISEQLFRLYQQTHERAKVRLFQIPGSFLSALAGAIGENDFRCSVLRKSDGSPVGFVTTIKNGETAIGYYIGVDYPTNESLPVYLRLLYAVIEDSLDLQCKRVSFGRTALEPKARLGCQPAPLSVSIRHRVPVLNMLVQPLLAAIPHDDPPERSPFKTKQN